MQPPVVKRIQLSIESRLENVSLVGLAVGAYCRFLELDAENAYQIELSVVEAVNNAILHAYQGQPDNRVRVAITLYTDRIAFEVCDSGQSMDKSLLADAAHKPDALDNLPETGRGLFLIRTVMDEISYETCHEINVLKMTRYLDRID